MKTSRKVAKAQRFFGQTYMYPTPNGGLQKIGVATFSDGTAAVGWFDHRDKFIQVRTPHLPRVNLLGVFLLSSKLAAYAKERGLASAPSEQSVVVNSEAAS